MPVAYGTRPDAELVEPLSGVHFDCSGLSVLCYFEIKRLRLPRLILSRSYRRLGIIAVAFVAVTYLITLYPLPDVDFVIPVSYTHLRAHET